MNCPTCGAALSPGETTCPACGADVTAAGGSHTSGAGTPPGAGRTGASPGGPAGWSSPAPHPSGLSSDVRGWGIAAHLSGLGLGLISVAMLGFLAPLTIWLIKRDEHPFVEHHAKEALNFQLTVLVVVLASVVLAIPAALLGVLTLGVGFVLIAVLLLAVAVLWFVLPIVAAVNAANGQGYRYPLTIRFVR